MLSNAKGADGAVMRTTVTKHPKGSSVQDTVASPPSAAPIPGAVLKTTKKNGPAPVPAPAPVPSLESEPEQESPVASTTVNKLPKVTKVSAALSIEQLRALRQHGSATLVGGGDDGGADSSVMRCEGDSSAEGAGHEEEETRNLICAILLRYCRGAEASSSHYKKRSNTEASGTENTELASPPSPEPAPPSVTPEIALFDELVDLCTTTDVTPHLLELVRELLSRTRVIPHYTNGGSAQQQALMEEVKRRESAQQLILILLNQLQEKKVQERLGMKTISTAALVQRVQEALHAMNSPSSEKTSVFTLPVVSEPTSVFPSQPTKPSQESASLFHPPSSPYCSIPPPRAPFARTKLFGAGPVAVPTHTTARCTRTTRFAPQQFSAPPSMTSPEHLAMFQQPFLESHASEPNPFYTSDPFCMGTSYMGNPFGTTQGFLPSHPRMPGGSGISVGSYGNLFAAPEPARSAGMPFAVLESSEKDGESEEDVMEALRDFMTAGRAEDETAASPIDDNVSPLYSQALDAGTLLSESRTPVCPRTGSPVVQEEGRLPTSDRLHFHTVEATPTEQRDGSPPFHSSGSPGRTETGSKWNVFAKDFTPSALFHADPVAGSGFSSTSAGRSGLFRSRDVNQAVQSREGIKDEPTIDMLQHHDVAYAL